MRVSCMQPRGWEIKFVILSSYQPDPEWFPFSVTVDVGGPTFVWMRREILKPVEVEVTDPPCLNNEN